MEGAHEQPLSLSANITPLRDKLYQVAALVQEELGADQIAEKNLDENVLLILNSLAEKLSIKWQGQHEMPACQVVVD